MKSDPPLPLYLLNHIFCKFYLESIFKRRKVSPTSGTFIIQDIDGLFSKILVFLNTNSRTFFCSPSILTDTQYWTLASYSNSQQLRSTSALLAHLPYYLSKKHYSLQQIQPFFLLNSWLCPRGYFSPNF